MSPRYSEENGVVVHLLHAKVLEEHTGVGIHVGPGVLHLASLKEDRGHQLIQLRHHLEQLVVGQMFQGKLPLASVSRVSFPKNCVSVSRHHTAGLEKAPDVCLGLVVGQVHADLLDHAIKEDQHLLVGEPVEGSSQAAHASGEGEVGVGEGRADQVGGVGRHIASLMVTVENSIQFHLALHDFVLNCSDPCMTISQPVDCEVKPHELGEERVLVANHLAEVGRPVLGRVGWAGDCSLPKKRKE